MTDLELASLHALRSLPQVGNKTLRLLVEYFGSGQAAWEHTGSFDDLGGLAPKAKESLNNKDTAKREVFWTELQNATITILHEDNPLYPRLLHEIPDRPVLLYVRGNFDWTTLNQKPTIALVGSRKFTAYGEQVAERLSYDLSQAGFVVVSGLAFGIDKRAHAGTLESGGETLAVLGGGLMDQDISPRSHLSLAKNILTQGALISEYPPHAEVYAANFPLRNRIIAGLSQGVVVIEAAEKSGSLITANLALDYNREVFAVPGSIFSPVSTGTHALIKRGAKLVTHAKDVIEELTPQLSLFDTPPEALPPTLTEKEILIYQVLDHEAKDTHILLQATRLSITELQATLTLLELKGLIKNIPGLGYRKH